jgi:hypothetical protein
MFRPLFVTSFARDMYLSTGVHLVASFFIRDAPGALLVCHEQRLSADIVPLADRLFAYDLDNSELLHGWLAQNRDIIPITLGGNADRCDSPEPDNAFGLHRTGCCWSWFNKNASRWFRKIVSLEQALMLEQFDAVIWVDSDCRFVEHPSNEEVESWFGNGSVFCLKGPRRVIESGIIGFRMNEGGRSILSRVLDRYRSGAFRQDPRWDDGYQFLLAMQGLSEVPVNDCAGESQRDGHVVAASRLGKYLSHAKGLHRLAGVMT